MSRSSSKNKNFSVRENENMMFTLLLLNVMMITMYECSPPFRTKLKLHELPDDTKTSIIGFLSHEDRIRLGASDRSSKSAIDSFYAHSVLDEQPTCNLNVEQLVMHTFRKDMAVDKILTRRIKETSHQLRHLKKNFRSGVYGMDRDKFFRWAKWIVSALKSLLIVESEEAHLLAKEMVEYVEKSGFFDFIKTTKFHHAWKPQSWQSKYSNDMQGWDYAIEWFAVLDLVMLSNDFNENQGKDNGVSWTLSDLYQMVGPVRFQQIPPLDTLPHSMILTMMQFPKSLFRQGTYIDFENFHEVSHQLTGNLQTRFQQLMNSNNYRQLEKELVIILGSIMLSEIRESIWLILVNTVKDYCKILMSSTTADISISAVSIATIVADLTEESTFYPVVEELLEKWANNPVSPLEDLDPWAHSESQKSEATARIQVMMELSKIVFIRRVSAMENVGLISRMKDILRESPFKQLLPIFNLNLWE